MIRPMIERPCPHYIVIDPSRAAGARRVDTDARGVTHRLYCEAGPYGHDGTHVGARPERVYRQLVRRWRESRATSRTPDDPA